MRRELRETLDLFADRHNPTREHPELRWPDAARFPLNLDGQAVAETVHADLREASEALIVTGYAALDQVIDFVADCRPGSRARILFGWEPFASRRTTFEFEGQDFPKEVEAYWLSRNISVFLSGKIVRCVELLESGQIEARYLRRSRNRLHAKIYCTERAATVGSSNFTRPGMHAQLEANARFTARTDPSRYRELYAIADNYWRMGSSYHDELIALLRRLLRIVTWPEALARACAELLEGEWALAYLRGEYLPEEGRLWPSQRQGIAQALYILTRRGSVLVADATGSGKTRMGVHLIGAVADHILRSGRLRHGKSLIVCPPVVATTWERESHLAGTSVDIYSHGVLSHGKSRKHDLMLEALRRAQILSIDEGHNFVNVRSARTQQLLRNMADYVLMFTATPLNRSVLDLLRIADMLGADNLEPATLRMFRQLLATRRLTRTLEEAEIAALRQEIKRFTVRRTKPVLNRLIARDPDQYVDGSGRRCRFPDHHAHIYPLNEPAGDREIAARISALADRLRAVAFFRQPIEMPDILREQGVTEERFLAGRLAAARKIAGYQVMKALRSSRVALAEHVVGTRQATHDFGLTDFRKSTHTGNVLAMLSRIKRRIPENRLSIALPDWLSDPDAHERACEADALLYQEVYVLLRQMSDGRERAKAALLLRLARERELILAFDSRPISLAEIHRDLRAGEPGMEVLVATGDPVSDRDRALEAFAPGSTQRRLVGLCSDSLSEGVNFQQAQALVHLDMPSVVRIAEQRAGRIDRLDSPHAAIEVWWPDDAAEFALSSDERFIERYETVDALLGSNLPLPESMRSGDRRPVTARQLLDAYEEEAKAGAWDGIQDAFEPVRALVSGEAALMQEEIYEHYRKVTARILTRVSLVSSATPWAFFCLAGGEFGAPRWVFLPSLADDPQTELEAVTGSLRERLQPNTESLEMDERAAKFLQEFVRRLDSTERSLLPTRKRRALDELEFMLQEMIELAQLRRDQEAVERLRAIRLAIVHPEPHVQPDLDEVAARWMDLIRPIWYACLKRPRSRPLLLKDIRPEVLKAEPQLRPRVLEAFARIPLLQTADQRIAACIAGIP